MGAARLIVPPLETGGELPPTLGPEVCDWIEAHLCHGPGDLLGEPVRLTDELRLLIWRAYELYPKGHELEGRRRFKRVVLSRRKGVGKTELAAWLAIAEMDPTSPVRFDGWHMLDGEWAPVGRPVRDPYIPMVAVTEEQTEDLAYGAVYAILAESALANDYDIGLERIAHKHSGGKIQAMASAPSARDGARTTFQHFDETHLFISARLKNAHSTMLRNIAKRRGSDPWTLETTTAYAPGEESIAENAHRYAIDVLEGRAKDSARILFDHRQAADKHKLTVRTARRSAIREASGDAWPWADVEAIDDQWADPRVAEEEFRRYWLNQPQKTTRKWIDVGRSWDKLTKKRRVPEGARVVLAFDGSYARDSTALIGCTVGARPHLFAVKVWERPINDPAWRTPRLDVEERIAAAMRRYQVLELAPDPPGWHSEVEEWEEAYGEVVVRFETNQPRRMGPACDDFFQAVHDERVTHDGSQVLRRHLANCVPVVRRSYTVVTKSAADSPYKIDAAVGAIVALHRAMWHAGQTEKEPLIAWG